MTPLNKPVTRQTAKVVNRRPVVITVAPCGSQSEALIELRLKGQRTRYVVSLSALYLLAAQIHAGKVRAAKQAARRNGIPWRKVKPAFDRANRIT